MVAHEFTLGPLGLPAILVEPPHEVFGHLLSMYTSGRLYDLIEQGIREVRQGVRVEYETGQDAHTVRITTESVWIAELEEYVGREPLWCVIPLGEFAHVLSVWRAHLSQRTA